MDNSRQGIRRRLDNQRPNPSIILLFRQLATKLTLTLRPHYFRHIKPHSLDLLIPCQLTQEKTHLPEYSTQQTNLLFYNLHCEL